MENALQYPLIVHNILKNLNLDDRRNCRLVCKVWNSEALRLLRNPLLHIFKVLSGEELKNCRLVSKKWNEYAEVQLRKKVHVKFSSTQDIVRFNQELPRSKHICLNVVFGKDVHIGDDVVQEFLKQIEPHTMAIELLRAKWNISSLGKLLNGQFNNLKSLRIVSGILPANPDGDRILLQQDQKSNDDKSSPKILPHLKKVIFDMNILDNKRKIRNGFVEFLSDLFLSVPHLKYFWCDSTSIYVRTYIHDFIVNSPDLLPNLTSLSTTIDYDENRLQRLESKRFPLTKVYLRIGNIDINILHSLLQSLKATLKQLGLHFNGQTARQSDSAKLFPCSKDLQNLELLDLVGFRGKLHFIVDFPKLKTLILKEVNIQDQFPFPPDEIPCPNLKELILVETNDSNADRKLASSHGRVKCLHYYSSDEFFYSNSPEKTWAEHQRDIYHFPFS